MAEEALLASSRAIPGRLRETGFVFRHRALETALRSVLEK
jgi:NAD dependent epimerase/dehydratase family enzyme